MFDERVTGHNQLGFAAKISSDILHLFGWDTIHINKSYQLVFAGKLLDSRYLILLPLGQM